MITCHQRWLISSCSLPSSQRQHSQEQPIHKGSLVHIPPGVLHGAKGRMKVLVVGIPDISDEDCYVPEDREPR